MGFKRDENSGRQQRARAYRAKQARLDAERQANPVDARNLAHAFELVGRGFCPNQYWTTRMEEYCQFIRANPELVPGPERDRLFEISEQYEVAGT